MFYCSNGKYDYDENASGECICMYVVNIVQFVLYWAEGPTADSLVVILFIMFNVNYVLCL